MSLSSSSRLAIVSAIQRHESVLRQLNAEAERNADYTDKTNKRIAEVEQVLQELRSDLDGKDS